MGQIITIGTHKGGTGKTTVATNLAFGLAKQNSSVLLIDIDGQSNVSTMLGIPSKCNIGRSLLSVANKEIELSKVVNSINDNLDIIYADYSMNLFDHYLEKDRSIKNNYVKILLHLKDLYDFIIIDTAPYLSFLNFCTIGLSDALILPFSMDRQDVQGLLSYLEELQKDKYRNIKTFLLANKYTERFQIDRSVIDSVSMLSKQFNAILLESKLPNSTLFKKSVLSNNLPLIAESSKSKQVIQKQETINLLINEIIEKLK